MCGIAGFVHASDVDPREFHLFINRMLTAIRYRGPDEIGCRVDDHGALGAVRLSIIDLRTGQQPMASPDGRYWLCFNGEIFNYIELRATLEALGRTFSTTSDTEVLLIALTQWGEAALERLDGQFGFALYDRRERSLLVARDRYGERPVYYTSVSGGLIFASEIKALLQYPKVARELCRDAIGNVFRLWTALPGQSCFRDIDSLPAGHFLKFRGGKIEVRRYYDLPVGRPASINKLDDAVVELRHRLSESVRLRLRSDVPIGVYLSGGLDSTIVTALVREQVTTELHSYSIAFADREYDESAFQRDAAARYETRHHEIRVESADLVRVFPEVVWHAETPLFRSAPAPMYLLASAVSADKLKVVMTGEGADEAFLGYDIFKETMFRANFNSFASDEERRKAIARLYPYMPGFDGVGRESLLRALDAHKSGAIDDPLFSHRMRFALGHFADRMLPEPHENAESTLSDILAARYPGFNALSPVARCRIIEYVTLLEGYLLCSQGDRMATAHGVEGRCPFLDHALVDLAFTLDEDLMLRHGIDEKFILKQAFADLLPPSVRARPKQPYRAPDSRAFLRHSADGWLDHVLSQSNIAQCGLFRPDIVSKFIGRLKMKPEAVAPREDQAFMLLISTLLLWQQFIGDFRSAPLTDFARFSVFAGART